MPRVGPINLEMIKAVRETGLDSAQAVVPDFFYPTMADCKLIITSSMTNTPPKIVYCTIIPVIPAPALALRVVKKSMRLIADSQIRVCLSQHSSPNSKPSV